MPLVAPVIKAIGLGVIGIKAPRRRVAAQDGAALTRPAGLNLSKETRYRDNPVHSANQRETVCDMLEVIDKGSVSESHPVPLLFVHGAWHAAWCWDEHFLSFFADKGYRALALSFRGHGDSTTNKPLRACSVADYVEDVRSVADRLPNPSLSIGNSRG